MLQGTNRATRAGNGQALLFPMANKRFGQDISRLIINKAKTPL
jgi:hypothetical protein